MSIDDAVITSGDYTNHIQSQDSVGEVTSFLVWNLSPQTVYYYQVRSLCDDAVSLWSPVQAVTTAELSALSQPGRAIPKVYGTDDRMVITGLSGEGRVAVYNLSGQLLFAEPVDNRSEIILGALRGVYVLKVITDSQIYNYKVRM